MKMKTMIAAAAIAMAVLGSRKVSREKGKIQEGETDPM